MIDGVIANMVSGIEIVQRAIDPMVKRKFGRIVAITSGGVKMPLPGLDLSSGARAGITAFLAGVARQVAQHNVTINFMLPGAFETERLQSVFNIAAQKSGGRLTPEQARADRLLTIPARRVGTPEEFGATCAFLCSAQAGFITGQNMVIDGGAYPAAF
jgi:3-oxoacyl-[acyl-carrier protein] reductase